MVPINDNMFKMLDNAGVFDSQGQSIFNEFADLAKSAADASQGPDVAARFLDSLAKIDNGVSEGATLSEQSEAAFASLGFLYGTAQLVTSTSATSEAFDLVYKKVPVVGTALTGTSLAINTTRVIDSALTPGQSVKTADLLGAASDLAGLAAVGIGAAAIIFGVAASPFLIAGLTTASVGLGIWSVVESLSEEVEEGVENGDSPAPTPPEPTPQPPEPTPQPPGTYSATPGTYSTTAGADSTATGAYSTTTGADSAPPRNRLHSPRSLLFLVSLC